MSWPSLLGSPIVARTVAQQKQTHVMGSPPCRRSPSNDNTCPRSGRIAAPKSQKYVPTTIYTQIYACIHMYNKYVYVCICMYVYIYVKIFIHIYIYIHMQVYGYMYIMHTFIRIQREKVVHDNRVKTSCVQHCVCACVRERQRAQAFMSVYLLRLNLWANWKLKSKVCAFERGFLSHNKHTLDTYKSHHGANWNVSWHTCERVTWHDSRTHLLRRNPQCHSGRLWKSG